MSEAERSSFPRPEPLERSFLFDTTVWSKCRSQPELVEWFNGAVADDLVLMCDVVELEVLKSSRDHQAFIDSSMTPSSLPAWSAPIGD